MKHIIFDCDNTFGVPDCDVDDGLTLIYLLGKENVNLLGITNTYGNNTLETVSAATQKLLKNLGREDIPLKKGSVKGEYDSEAADFLAEMARKYKGELSILATGSLTNLMGAYLKDNEFFDNVKEIVLMGGITEPLVFEKKVMDELNFSCDAKATHLVLTKGRNVSVITGNNCLKVLFTKDEYKEKLFGTDNKMAKFIREETDYWFGYNEGDYGIKGFYNWDVTAAVYLMEPALFEDDVKQYNLSEKDLETGFLRADENGSSKLNLPKIGEEKPFKDEIYSAWFNAAK